MNDETSVLHLLFSYTQYTIFQNVLIYVWTTPYVSFQIESSFILHVPSNKVKAWEWTTQRRQSNTTYKRKNNRQHHSSKDKTNLQKNRSSTNIYCIVLWKFFSHALWFRWDFKKKYDAFIFLFFLLWSCLYFYTSIIFFLKGRYAHLTFTIL